MSLTNLMYWTYTLHILDYRVENKYRFACSTSKREGIRVAESLLVGDLGREGEDLPFLESAVAVILESSRIEA